MLKSEITEVPFWASQGKGNTDNWFLQQLAAFASARLSVNGGVVTGQFDYSGGLGAAPITTAAEPKAIITCCPDNISIGGSFMRFGSPDIFIALEAPTSVQVLADIGLFADSLTQNADGTWTFDIASPGYGINNSTTDPDYYAIFTQG